VRDEGEEVEATRVPGGQVAEQLVGLGEGGGVAQRALQMVCGPLRLAAGHSGSCLLKRAVGGAACIHEREQ
jgi:hypothetical protein